MLRHFTRPGGYNTLSMLNSAEQEISTAHKTKMVKNKDFSCSQTVQFGIYHANK